MPDNNMITIEEPTIEIEIEISVQDSTHSTYQDPQGRQAITLSCRPADAAGIISTVGELAGAMARVSLADYQQQYRAKVRDQAGNQ